MRPSLIWSLPGPDSVPSSEAASPTAGRSLDPARELSVSLVMSTSAWTQRNTQGPCDWGETGNLVKVEMNDSDNAIIKDVVQNTVLKRFAERCGRACAEEWNATMGEIAGVKAPLPAE